MAGRRLDLGREKEQSVTSGPPTPESPDLRVYLDCTDILDWQTPEVQSLADVLVAGAPSDVEKAKRLYEWVRDEIPHSGDAGHETVTCRASEVLRQRHLSEAHRVNGRVAALRTYEIDGAPRLLDFLDEVNSFTEP